MEIALMTAMSLLGICMGLFLYRQGVRDGLAMQKGQEPEPITTPVKLLSDYRESKSARLEAMEAKVESDKIEQGWENIFAYEGEKQFGGGDLQ